MGMMSGHPSAKTSWRARILVTTVCLSMFVPVQAWAAPAQVGLLDPSFGGGDGMATAAFANAQGVPLDAHAAGVALQPDGKILIAGSVGSRFVVVRYGPGGGVDRSFGDAGKAGIGFPGRPTAAAIALQPNGKILVAGTAFFGSRFAVARFEVDGSADPTFGGDGSLTTLVSPSQNAEATSIALQPDGKIVVAGTAQFGTVQDFAAVRYQTDGSLDPSFGAGGIVDEAFSVDARANGVAIQVDGGIVLAGTAASRFVLARLSSDGTLDPSFNGSGTVETWFGSAPLPNYQGATAVAVQPDGKIVAAGYANGPYDTAFAMARYLTDGSLDTTFNGDGRVKTLDGSSIGFQLSANAIAIAPDGAIVLAGAATSGTPEVYAWSWVTARYGPDGLPDQRFSGDGLVMTGWAPQRRSQEAVGAAVQPDGDIVVSGRIPGRGHELGLLRYAAADFRPDARLGGRYYEWVGDDVYTADASHQHMRVFNSLRRSRVELVMENDGTSQDRYVVSGCHSSALFTVGYAVNGRQVTRAVASGTYRTPRLDPGSVLAMNVTVIARPGTGIGAAIACVLRLRSTRMGGRIDAVQLIWRLESSGCRVADRPGDAVVSCA